MQKFTLIAFFAQTTEPMFTDNSTIAAYMPKWARSTLLTFRTIGTVEKLANGSC
jgi:hypothetical protein